MARDDIDNQKVLELREQGLTQQRIADMFGCTRQHIAYISKGNKPKHATDYKRVCQECGTLFTAGSKAKYCPECKKQKQREVKETENRTWKDMTRAKKSEKKSTHGFVPAKCPEDCVYIQKIHGNPMCGYLDKTGELRGCDPGPGCKCYVSMRGMRKHRKTEIF